MTRLAATPTKDDVEVWFAGFTDTDESGHWIRRFLRWLPHPRHVVVFRDTPGGLLSLQQTLAGMLPVVQVGCTAANFKAEIEADGGVVHTFVVHPEARKVVNLRPFNCVDIARSVACLPYRPQTPRAFARQLAGRR